MVRQLTIPTADTQLYAIDSQAGSPPLLFLSGEQVRLSGAEAAY
jgi:hypothetical protein